MWVQLVLFCLVGLAYGSNNPGWTENQEYIYRVSGRVLTGMREVSNQYSGFLFRGRLRIQPRANGKLQVLLVKPEISPVHSVLSDGWPTYLPEEDRRWKSLPMTKEPFQIQMENGRIVNLVVSSSVKNYEANMIKGLISPFQLNTNGEDALPNPLNVLPWQHSDNAMYLAMEDTVSGQTETLYQVHKLPPHLALVAEQAARLNELKLNGDVIEIVKSKNYTNAKELPLYAFGFRDYMLDDKPGDTNMADFINRDLMGHATIVGDLRRYTILNSSLVNSLLVNPTVTDQQKAGVVSAVNVNLLKIKTQDEKIENIQDPVDLGNLVYTLSSDDSLASNSQKLNQINDDNQYGNSNKKILFSHSHAKRSTDDETNEYEYTLDQPENNEAPIPSMFPLTMGNEGKSIKESMNIVQEAVKLAKTIGSELKDSEKDHHEKTLDRFVSLVSLIRIMNVEEIKQVTEHVYTDAEGSQEKATWVAIRDAVPEAGTGPALLVIKSWIASKKIQNTEAAQIVATLARATRYPTLKYMRTFFELTKNEDVLRQGVLNETSLLSYAQLVRAVYTDQKMSEIQFPVLTYGPFRTREGIRFVIEEVIPHYTQMLHRVIQRNEIQKIHAYIQTLGHIAHPKILAAYEPYLEGDKQSSQFQRLLMVLSMNKLSQVYPEETLSVASRIYQNRGEHPAVRIASIFVIMNSRPTYEILQLMAQNTNIETNEHVNAAVKSSIEQLSEMDGDHVHEMRERAKTARLHLTNKNYGVNDGQQYLRTYVMDELNVNLGIDSQLIPSEDKYLPKGIKYTSYSSMAGLYRQKFSVLAIVSNLDQLLKVGWKQTKIAQDQIKKQKQNSQQEQYPWSHINIAKILNVQNDEREELEGLLSLEMGSPLAMFSFNNATLNKLPEIIRKWEQELNKGKKINQYKVVSDQLTLAVPTAMGVPAIYYLQTPMLFKTEGEIVATANPQVSQGDLIHTPDQIKMETQLRVTVSAKTQGRLVVVSPFERQKYISGYDKHWEMNLPMINAKVNVDLNKKELKTVIKSKQERDVKLLHLATWPYTAISDVMDLEPLTSQKGVKQIEPKTMQGFKTVVGEKSTGIAIEIEVKHERKPLNLVTISRILSNNGLINGIKEIWEHNNIQNSLLDITYLPEHSSVQQINIVSKYDQEYHQSPEPRQGKWSLNEKADPAERQRELMKEVSGGIKSAQVVALDNTIKLEGDKNIQLLLTGAAAKSNVDPKSRVVVSFKRSSESQDVKDYEAHVFVRNVAENTNEMDLEISLQNQPKMETEMDAMFGISEDKLSKIRAKLEYTRSEDRKRYLKELPMTKQCQQEMREGNKALHACTQMNMAANLLDRVQIKIQHQDVTAKVKEVVKMVYEALRVHLLPSLEIKTKPTPVSESEIVMNVRFHEDLEYLNATLQIQNEETTLKNLKINEIIQEIIVSHPVYNVRDRVISQIYGMDSYKDFCTIDKSKVVTFSNKTYDADISNKWTVAAIYTPKPTREIGQDQQEEYIKQLRSEVASGVILLRRSTISRNKKDVKIVISNPQTNFRIADIELTPSQGGQVKGQVSVNGRQIPVSTQQSHDLYEGSIQVYALPNGEVKIESAGFFDYIYDGERLRLTASNDKIKDATRGLCGQFNDQPSEDLLASVNCMARSTEKFVKSFEIEGDEGKQIRDQFARDDNQCVEKEVPLYANVITSRDTRAQGSNDVDQNSQQQRTDVRRNQETRHNKCWTRQTRYVDEDGEICFTTMAVPACRNGCQQSSSSRTEVAVHCLKKSKVVELWKKQIDNGGNPDFSNKKQHKTVTMSVAESCSP